jgi:predicted porin
MQKKLIVLAIASAMTVPALAYAEVNISGQANMAIDMVNNGYVNSAVNGNVASASANQLNSNQSRVVIKGSDDLGNGLSAMYQLDTRLNVDTGTAGSTFWAGNTFVGLKSNDMGTVMLGRIDAPYKTAFRGLDVFFDVAGDNRSGVGNATTGGGLFATDVRMNNVIAYKSPNFSGFQVSAASVFGAENPSSAKKGQALSLAGTYSMDNIFAAAAYQTVKLGDPGTGDLAAGTSAAACPTTTSTCPDDEAKSWKIGGGYTMDAFTINAELEGTTYSMKGFSDNTGTNYYLAGTFALSSTDSIRAAYTRHGETEGGMGVAKVKNKDGANQFAIGYNHSMSKATSVYATYVKTSADDGYNVTDNLAAASQTGAAQGSDPSVISIGMKHAF